MSEVIEEFIRTHSDLQEREAFETFLRQDRIKTWVGGDQARRDRLQREFSRVWGTIQGASAAQAQVTAAVQRPHAPPPLAPPPPPSPSAPREAPPSERHEHAPALREAPAPREAPAAREPPTREPARATRVQVRHERPERTERPERVERPERAAPAERPAHEARRTSSVASTRRLNLLCPACAKLDVWLQEGEISCHHCGRTYDDMLALVPVKPVGPFEYVFGEGPVGYLKAGGVGLLLLAVYGVLKWL